MIPRATEVPLRKQSILPYVAAFAALFALATPNASAARIYGYTAGNQIVTFDSATPGTINSTVSVTGLIGGDTVSAIDIRPANGVLYALNGTGTRIYTINLISGVATQVGTDGLFALTGSGFGMDFNPTVDRIRLTSAASEQNLRVHPDTGALVSTDTPLAYAAGDANAGANPNIAGVAYTNNFAGAVTTTLYGIDANLDVLVTINPPNNGQLNTVGALGINFAGDIGFDITPGGQAFASSGAGGSSLYSINLATGSATLVGAIGNGQLALRGLAADAGVPEPGTLALMGIGLAVLIGVRRR